MEVRSKKSTKLFVHGFQMELKFRIVPFLKLIYFFFITLDYAFHFPEKGIKDVVKISGMKNSLTAFTVCFWMNLNTSEACPFSYAVSSQDNELQIFYNKNFQLIIGDTTR